MLLSSALHSENIRAVFELQGSQYDMMFTAFFLSLMGWIYENIKARLDFICYVLIGL